MKVRIKTLEELKSQGADITPYVIRGMGGHYMNQRMMSYLGRKIDLYYHQGRDTYYNDELTGLHVWESWMFEEVKEMNRNGANDES